MIPRIRRRTLVAFAFGYAFMTFFLWAKQRDFLYFPVPAVPAPAAAGFADMSVIDIVTPRDGLALRGWYRPPADAAQPGVVMFHGNGGGIDIRAYKSRPFTARGYGFLLAEYRGYSGNPGTPGEQGFYDDARGYIETLTATHGIAPERLIFYGESLGTGVATQMAREYPQARALILETPYTNLAWLAQTRVFWIPTYFLMRDKFDNAGKIGGVSMPVLILHGTRDRVVPYSHGQALFARAAEPKRLETFPGGDHIDLFTRGAADKILAFLDDHAR